MNFISLTNLDEREVKQSLKRDSSPENEHSISISLCWWKVMGSFFFVQNISGASLQCSIQQLKRLATYFKMWGKNGNWNFLSWYNLSFSRSEWWRNQLWFNSTLIHKVLGLNHIYRHFEKSFKMKQKRQKGWQARESHIGLYKMIYKIIVVVGTYIYINFNQSINFHL